MDGSIEPKEFQYPDFIPHWFRLNKQSDHATFFLLDSSIAHYKKIVSYNTQDAKKAWVSLNKRYSTLAPDKADGFARDFFYALIYFKRELPFEETFTKSARASLLDEINDVTGRMMALINRIDSDYPLSIFTQRKAREYEHLLPGAGLSEAQEKISCSLSDAIEMWKNDALRRFDGTHRLIDRPSSGDALTRYFCHKITWVFCQYFDQPLYAVTAALASAHFDTIVDPDYVRFTAKDTVVKWRKSWYYHREFKSKKTEE